MLVCLLHDFATFFIVFRESNRMSLMFKLQVRAKLPVENRKATRETGPAPNT